MLTFWRCAGRQYHILMIVAVNRVACYRPKMRMMFGCTQKQGIVPESATAQVKELFVPESRVQTAKREAGQLASLDINQVQRLPIYLHLLYSCT